jgi:hypothetical protein
VAKTEFSRIIDSLSSLQNRRSTIFGADAHGFHLNPTLPEGDVRAFELRHSISLPRDYREFLIKVGNGGAGPHYGIFRLGEMDDNFDMAPWREGDSVGILSNAFPFEEEWNDISAMPKRGSEALDKSKYWEQMSAFEEVYWGTSVVNGSFPICHQGCALRILLIVTGPQAGYLWDDRRSEYAGLKPLRLADGSRATFLRWYEEWLEGCLAAL